MYMDGRQESVMDAGRTLSLGGRLFLPRDEKDARGLLLLCPGGGYGWLSPREGEPVARAFAACGWASAMLHYAVREDQSAPRLGTLPLRQLGEALEAVRNAYPGKPVAVMGFSAGAHLAASLGVHWRTMGLPKPDALVLCYPVITAGPYAHRWSVQNLAPEGEQDFYSLENHAGAHVPPTFLWHTAADESVPVENSLMFAAALSRAKVPFELHVFPYGGHGLSLATQEVCEAGREPDPHVARWVSLCAAWLALTLGGAPEGR